jgi:hypothetical protein
VTGEDGGGGSQEVRSRAEYQQLLLNVNYLAFIEFDAFTELDVLTLCMYVIRCMNFVYV